MAGWKDEENLSLVIYRHPFARLSSAYYNKIWHPTGGYLNHHPKVAIF